ncbi:MAG: tail fiber protein [Verrucomicrobiota bacterium]
MTQSPSRRSLFRILIAHWPQMARVATLATILGAASDVALAQTGFPPSLMSYQGFLVDANGAALAPSNPINYSVVFRIYGTSTGGSSLWTEAQTVTIDKGNFSVVLGEGGAEGSELRPDLSTVFNSNRASDLYLGITVKNLSATSSEILPRLRLLTSPYSFLARTANTLSGGDGAALINSSEGRLRIGQALQTTGGNARGANAVDLQTARLSSSPGQVASGEASVLTGGQNNSASGRLSVIAGGSAGTASGAGSVIGGGDNNVASGRYSAVPGGQYNTASGDYSLAAGRRAKAVHAGSMVFGDSTDADRSSTAANQFLIYSSGGVGINSVPASGAALTVSGKVKAGSAEFDAMNVANLTATTVSGNGTVPLGGIIMWSGSTVPTGWALCDGSSSSGRQTPDLRGRFVVGAGQGANLANRILGTAGGTESVTLTVGQLPAHNHVVKGTTSENGDHSHVLPRMWADDGNGCCQGDGMQGLWGDSGKLTWSDLNKSQNSGNHTHTFNVTSDSTGSGNPIDKMPPFYALAFIMRVQ